MTKGQGWLLISSVMLVAANVTDSWAVEGGASVTAFVCALIGAFEIARGEK